MHEPCLTTIVVPLQIAAHAVEQRVYTFNGACDRPHIFDRFAQSGKVIPECLCEELKILWQWTVRGRDCEGVARGARSDELKTEDAVHARSKVAVEAILCYGRDVRGWANADAKAPDQVQMFGHRAAKGEQDRIWYTQL